MRDRTRRILIIPRVIWDGAWSFWGWQFISKKTIKPAEIQDYMRRRNIYGWLSAAMDIHWASYVVKPDKHQRKNLGSEWFRTFAQEAYKISSFAILALLALLIGSNLLWALLWWIL